VWVVDLVNGQLLTFCSPVDGKYEQQTSAAPGMVPLSALPDISLDLSGLAISNQP
jgi:hypothetical protein